MSRRFQQCFVVGACTLAMVFMSLARYELVWAGTISCCCGDHDSNQACGCSSCPAGHDHDEEETQIEDQITGCGGSWFHVVAQAVHLMPAPQALTIVPPAPRRTSRGPEPPDPWPDPELSTTAPDS